MTTAAIVVIGNEILSGKYRDENSPWLAIRLREIGVDLLRIVTIPDEVDLIARTVRELSELCDHVFTSGGVGPTHDDLTMLGVARAFGLPLERHPELEATLRKRLGERCNDAALRMAEIPRGAELWREGSVMFPQVVVRNVVIFPGVPGLLRMKFDGIAHRFAGDPVLAARLVTTRSEPEIADLLTHAQERWPQVSIGSYPHYEQQPYTVTVTMDSRDAQALAACETFLVEGMTGSLVYPV